MRAEMNVPMGKRSAVILAVTDESLRTMVSEHQDYFRLWAGLNR